MEVVDPEQLKLDGSGGGWRRRLIGAGPQAEERHEARAGERCRPGK